MWNQLLRDLKDFYSKCKLGGKFSTEELYFTQAFHDIESLWNSNFNNNVLTVKYILLSEAPLWGEEEKYIYNPIYENDSSFFRCSDLSYALNGKPVDTKADLIIELNKIGFLIVDISPYALNKKDTSINYPQLSNRKKNNYHNLIQPTLGLYFDDKLRRIVKRIDEKVKVFYRYPRIEKHLGLEISILLQKYNLNVQPNPYSDIFKQGGGIDKDKLKSII